MMTLKEIQDLVKLVNKLELTEFEMRNGDFKIAIRTKHGTSQPEVSQNHIVPVPGPQVTVAQPVTAVEVPVAATQSEAAQAPVADAPTSSNGEDTEDMLTVRSPIVGTFYRSPAPEKPPYIKVGDTIDVGSVVCIVEAMKLFNEIESEVAGKIVKMLVQDASPVEYDQPLFLVDPTG